MATYEGERVRPDRPPTTQPRYPSALTVPPPTSRHRRRNDDSHEPIRKLMHDMPRLCMLQRGNGSDNYLNAELERSDFVCHL